MEFEIFPSLYKEKKSWKCFSICFKACTKNGVVNFSVIKFISDNEDLDQLIPYRGVYKGKFSPKNVTS